MKCDLCENEASTHEVVIKGGKKFERHLCEACSKKAGIDAKPSVPISQLLTQFMVSAAPAVERRPAEVKPPRCEACGTTFADFKGSALLGCPECYRAMEAQLGPIIERAHEGATHHVGKVPRRALAASRSGAGRSMEAILGSMAERAQRVAALRKQLEEAVRSEQYERAARIRDEMRGLGEVEGE